MPYSVISSFSKYQTDTVDLDPDQVKRARVSRDWLVSQIRDRSRTDLGQLQLRGEYKPFGSFARKTKVRPLDDIDLLLPLEDWDVVSYSLGGNRYYLVAEQFQTRAFIPLYDERNRINSTAILNKIKAMLASVPQYSKAEIKRNNVAVVLNLISYNWSFDIVPAFPVWNYDKSIKHYLIPDGTGQWMATDPRVDQTLVTEANQRQNGKLLSLIRLFKYWNTYRNSPPKLPSYYLEILIINSLRYSPNSISDTQASILRVFQALQHSVLQSCLDPKGLGPDLDKSVDLTVRQKFSQGCQEMVEFAENAIRVEKEGKIQLAIYYWSRIFPNFPEFG